ncbi:MAG: Ig-like domain-containing protein [Eubacteriales bacterium]|nr:Ig-like domain-containing protein [Eubacteriales bacterium]
MSVARAQATVNGITIALALNSSTGKWEGTGTAPAKSSYGQSGHYYGVTLEAWDEAGNLTTKDVTDTELGAALQLIVKEKVAPVITITSPTSGQLTSQAKPEISWKVTDDDSGVNPATIGITIDSGTKVTGDAITKTAITGGYQCTYTPSTALVDGEHTIKFDASDYDGNAATQKSVTFSVLSTKPNLSITSPAEGAWFKSASVSFDGTTNATSLTVKVGNGAAQNITITDGEFSGTITLPAEGENTLTFVATGASGLTTTVTRKVKLDTNAPSITAASITPNPVDCGKTFTISVTITD